MSGKLISREQADAFLTRAFVGRLSTLDSCNHPYTVPVHFVYQENTIYIHSRKTGQKIENLQSNPYVCFECDEMGHLLLGDDGSPCNTSTQYTSVIAFGEARILEGPEEQKAALALLIQKYTPHLANAPIPDQMAKITSVIAIDIAKITGKRCG